MTTLMTPRIVRADAMPEDAPEVAVAIVGAGACGLTTAIRLRQGGVECVLLERDALPAGSTALSSGLIPAAGTRLQKSLGIDDSLETFAEDIIAKTGGEAPPHLVKAYVEAVPHAIDALEALGITFEVQDGFLFPGHRVRRMHGVPEHTG
ncbi:MAG TPA: FAD-dependent oxidoreductase, partial [Ottowia sp.]|nr:FAD-dependent oxidoreductase [Ottowia sp.]